MLWLAKKGLSLFFMMFLFKNMTSCVIVYDAQITSIEIMKPAQLNFPEHVKKVALINSMSNNKG